MKGVKIMRSLVSALGGFIVGVKVQKMLEDNPQTKEDISEILEWVKNKIKPQRVVKCEFRECDNDNREEE